MTLLLLFLVKVIKGMKRLRPRTHARTLSLSPTHAEARRGRRAVRVVVGVVVAIVVGVVVGVGDDDVAIATLLCRHC